MFCWETPEGSVAFCWNVLLGTSVVLPVVFPVGGLLGWSRLHPEVLHKHKTHCGIQKSCFVMENIGGMSFDLVFCLLFVFILMILQFSGFHVVFPSRVNM